MIGCAAILVDITPGARVPGAKVPAAIVGKATKPAVPTMEVITVLPAIVIAGTEEKQSTRNNEDYIFMVEPSKWARKNGNIILTTRGHVKYNITDSFLRWKPPFRNGHLKLDSSLWKHFLHTVVVVSSQEHSYVVLGPHKNKRLYDLSLSFSLHVLASPCS